MQIQVQIQIQGLEERAKEISSAFIRRADSAIDILFNQLYKQVQINLSDNILRIRTGKLIGSLEYSSFISSTEQVITAYVGTNTPYAAYQEYGYRGVIATYKGATRNVDYAGRPYVNPALIEIAKNVGSVLAMEINYGA